MLRRIFVGAAAASLVAGPGRSQTATQGGDATGAAELIIAALAALDRHGQIDASMVIDYLGYLREGGIESILVNGSTGEFASFTTLERKFALQTYLRHKGNMRALCHVGASSLPDTLDLLRHAQGAGAEVALVVPPYYYMAEHWGHLRTTNPIESTFATIRLRHRKTKGNGTRRASLAMMFKLAQSASKKWNRLRSHEKMTLVVEGRSFQDGILQEFAA